MLPIQPGDVPDTLSDTSSLSLLTGYAPSTDVRSGIRSFVNWYLSYYCN